MPKNAVFFNCEKCNFTCSKKSNFNSHLLTQKHNNTAKKLTNTDTKNAENAEISNNYVCECGKKYKHRQSLFNHVKKCFTTHHTNNNMDNKNEPTDKELIVMLLKQNTELIEVIKNGTNVSNTVSNNNSHNKTFNLQFFLNETCKDAMNIMDFVESIQVQLSDLEKVGEIGYVDGISNIIVKNLKALDVTQRPLHCTDKKRDVLYLKDENKWEKQGEDNYKLKTVIRKVTDKNIRMIPQYKAIYPDCNQSDSKYSDQYTNIIMESMGGFGDNHDEKEIKIIKNISKEVTLEKENE